MILEAAQSYSGGYAFPRTRGDDPMVGFIDAVTTDFSPHPRG